MVFVCFHLPGSGVSTDTEPRSATRVRSSTWTGVPDVVPWGSPSLGGSPPQLLTYTLSSPARTTANGATPTATVCSASRLARLTSWTLLPRVDATHRSSADCTATPDGWTAPPTRGLISST